MGKLNRGLTICKACGVPDKVHKTNSWSCWKCSNCGDLTDGKPEIFQYARAETVTYTISADTVDRIVHRFYPASAGTALFSFVDNGDCIPGDCEKYFVTGEDFIKEYADHFRKCGDWGDMYNCEILDILCADGWLDSGNYKIETPE